MGGGAAAIKSCTLAIAEALEKPERGAEIETGTVGNAELENGLEYLLKDDFQLFREYRSPVVARRFQTLRFWYVLGALLERWSGLQRC